jgi:hypothetical protein
VAVARFSPGKKLYILKYRNVVARFSFFYPLLGLELGLGDT